MPDKIRIIQFGLGPIGCAMARQVAEHAGLELVGGVDIDPARVGQDVGRIIGMDQPLGFPVAEKLEQALAHTQADVALHTTSSYFDLFKPQIVDILEAGLDVVSTAEELSFPWLAHPREAAEIDALAKRVDKTVLGTGINPGFIMDSLPLFLTSICLRVEHIEVTRVINASLRRGPFQAKIGSGITPDQFKTRLAAGRMGHVGLPESMHMVFHTLGRRLERYEDSVEPVLADRVIKTGHFEVHPGQVRGLKQMARGYTDKGEFMRLIFLAALDAGDDGDTVKITGVPNLEVNLKGTNGDIATVAITVNAIRRLRQSPPGLITMRDLPILTVW